MLSDDFAKPVLDGIVGFDFFFAAAQRCKGGGLVLQSASHFGLYRCFWSGRKYCEEMIVGVDGILGAIQFA